VDDPFEENDTRAASRSLSPDVYTDLRICPRDEDWYELRATAAGTLDVLIDGWAAATTDIDLQLVRGDGTPMRSSEGIDASEQIRTCVNPGTYYLRVYGIADDQGPYSLAADLTAGACCDNDALEPNESWTAATPLPAPARDLEGRVCAGDNDWFRFEVPAGRRVTADLAIDAGSGDLDLELYAHDGRLRLAVSNGVGAAEHLEADVATAGPLFLRVFGFRGAEGGYRVRYALGSTAGCASSAACPRGTICNGTACVDDACTPGESRCPADAFCPEAGGAGGASDCVDACLATSDCRTGYACKAFAAGGGCGLAGAGLTGDRCASFRDCAGERICMAWPGGYCARAGCLDEDDCPAGAHCVDVDGRGVCMKDCLRGDSACRAGEGYRCQCARDRARALQWICIPPGAAVTRC
jgi:hypothetical protein